MKAFLVAFLIANVSNVVQGRLTGAETADSSSSSSHVDESSTGRQLSTELTFKGQNGMPASAYPLGLCDGSCRGDYDCGSNLICYTATSSMTTVPGCQGSANAGVSYCVKSSSSSMSSSTSSGGTVVVPVPISIPSSASSPALSPSSLKRFRLRLYWEQGYTWGGKTTEQRLCMQCVSKPCQKNDILTLQPCSSKNAVFRFLSPTPVANTVQIRIVGTSLCLEKTGHRAIKAEHCRAGTYTKQFWFGGDLSKSKFELNPDGFSTLCVASDGVRNDPIYAQSCVDKRKIDVTNWTPF